MVHVHEAKIKVLICYTDVLYQHVATLGEGAEVATQGAAGIFALLVEQQETLINYDPLLVMYTITMLEEDHQIALSPIIIVPRRDCAILSEQPKRR